MDFHGWISQPGTNLSPPRANINGKYNCRKELGLKEELIGLIPAAGKGVRLGLPYPKELYPVIRDNHYKPISQFVLDSLIVAGLNPCGFCHQ